MRVRLPLGHHVNAVNLDSFSRKCLNGFLRPKLIRSNVVEYSGPIAISLYRRMQRPISKFDFFFLIEQIINGTLNLQKNSFPWCNVVWDLNHIYVNEATNEIQLIYLPPEEPAANLVNLLEFLVSIVYSVKPADMQDSTFATKFLYFLKGLKQYDPVKIETYISNVDRNIVNTIKGRTVSESGFMTDKRKVYYDHYNKDQQNDDEATGLLSDEDEATGLLHDDDEATGLLNDDGGEATGLLDEDEATSLLREEKPHYPTLLRVRTDEHVSINKPVFRIGKERSYVDFFVANNGAVSRSHADIITRESGYYVRDLNSTNKTYINGKPITAWTEHEIHNGDSLTLGNEEFLFQEDF